MITATTLCQQFLNENVLFFAESTLDTIERAFRYFVRAVGNRQIDRIEPDDGERYKAWHLKTSRSKTTANIHLRSVNWVLNWAVDPKKILAANPLARIKQFRITRNPVRIYEPDQVERMLRFAPNVRWRSILLTAYQTGLRRGEILNLTRDNVRGGFIYVEPKRSTRQTWEWEPKDKEIRSVPVTAELQATLTAASGFYVALDPGHVSKLLELNRMGLLKYRQRKCPEENFRRTFVTIQRRAFGRQLGSFHQLRKTFTTMMCEGLPDYYVMRLTGHSSLKTMTYYLASRESQADTVREIASRGLKKGPPVSTEAQPQHPVNGVNDWAVQDSNL